MEGTPSSLHEWRDKLRDIDFWLNGDGRLSIHFNRDRRIHWILGVGPMASFTRAIMVKARSELGPFNPIIKVDLKWATLEPEALQRLVKELALVTKEVGLLTTIEKAAPKSALLTTLAKAAQESAHLAEEEARLAREEASLARERSAQESARLAEAEHRLAKAEDDGLPRPGAPAYWTRKREAEDRLAKAEGRLYKAKARAPLSTAQESTHLARAKADLAREEVRLAREEVKEAYRARAGIVQPRERAPKGSINLLYSEVIVAREESLLARERAAQESARLAQAEARLARERAVLLATEEALLASMKYQLVVAVAKELGLLDQQYDSLKEEHDDLQHYSYGCYVGISKDMLERHVWDRIVPQINKRLFAQRYLLLVENLQLPLDLDSVTRVIRLPPPDWTLSMWLLSTTSRDVYNKSKLEDHGAISIHKDDHVLLLALSALSHSAEHIFNMIRQESKEYWHRTALRCFHYAMTIFATHSRAVTLTPDELIHQWAAQGILPARMCTKQEEEETGTCRCSSKSAYMHQVGKVILEAFQEYSLLQLPFSPAKNTNEATQTAAHFFAYKGLIAEDITVDELSDSKKKWISFMDDHGWHVSREWLSQEETCGPTALILRGCSPQSLIFFKLDHFLPKVCFLRVLDLSYTPLKSLPASIGCLHNLRLLSLRGCHDLETLFSSSTTSTTDSTMNTFSYSPLSTLCQLEILDMNGVPSSHLTQDMVHQKRNLIHLDMSYSQVTTFPHNFFQEMSNLEELILVNCSNLVELPHSMAALSSLMTLEVTGTEIKYFPQKIFEEMQKLQSLKLTDNKKLISLPRPISRAHILINLHGEEREWIMGEGIKLERHPTLISFLLIGSPHIRHLSLHGCRKLESVDLKDLGALEELDLSGTAIKELPANIPNLPQLKQLLLMGVPSLRRFPWHKLERLPNVFCLDHCAEGSGDHYDQAARVCVSDSRFFYSFDDTAVCSVRNGRFFQSFYVRFAPCITSSRRLQDEEDMINTKLHEFMKKQSTYLDVYNIYHAEEIAIASPIAAPLRRTERHMEITGMQYKLHGLHHLSQVTKSISVTCDNSIYCFSKSWPWNFNFVEMEECELRWCHKMEVVFHDDQSLKHLRNVHVCNLKSLLHFCPRNSGCAFSALKHLHIECCPRLEDVMPDTTTLPCLKTLDIMFCYKLKTIFYNRVGDKGGTYQLPSLQRIRLLELPLLQHFDDNDAAITAPMWKELHVRGCWSLRRLPCLQYQSETVKVNGERSWWDKLQWGSPSRRHNSYKPKLPPEFASFDQRAVMSSYLR